MKLALSAITLLLFGAFSVWLCFEQGYFGFITLAMREAWGLQMLIDLAIAVFLLSGYLIKDARQNNIPAWPFVLAMIPLGSIGALEYIVFREVKKLYSGRDIRSVTATAS